MKKFIALTVFALALAAGTAAMLTAQPNLAVACTGYGC